MYVTLHTCVLVLAFCVLCEAGLPPMLLPPPPPPHHIPCPPWHNSPFHKLGGNLFGNGMNLGWKGAGWQGGGFDSGNMGWGNNFNNFPMNGEQNGGGGMGFDHNNVNPGFGSYQYYQYNFDPMQGSGDLSGPHVVDPGFGYNQDSWSNGWNTKGGQGTNGNWNTQGTNGNWNTQGTNGNWNTQGTNGNWNTQGGQGMNGNWPGGSVPVEKLLPQGVAELPKGRVVWDWNEPGLADSIAINPQSH
ncbi:N66 matrix protein-like [Mya arenaria]|uniref:N66 matrix protein-like n=1 Tax=Mya arenaria TaxID=6604 RepID=UPI0022E554D5|nr:N66 matrix protein-like [Mya arenaria]